MGLLRRLFISFFIGTNSGIVYAALGGPFSAYLVESGVTLSMLGLLSIRLTPYSYKFLYAPFVESLRLKIFPANFGQRRSWMIAMQCLLICLIGVLGFIDPNSHVWLLCFLTTLIALISAIYDIALSGYRIELFAKKESGKGNTANVLGFRIGLLTSGAGALIFANYFPWSTVFIFIALTIIPAMLVIILVAEDDRVISKQYTLSDWRLWIKNEVLNVLLTIFKIPKFYLVILIVAFFKVSDAYLDAMMLPFLLESGFDKVEIATVVKSVGLLCTILGTFLGAWAVERFSIGIYLLFAESFAAVTNLLFIFVERFGNKISVLFLVNGLESIANGIVNIACITYINSLCDRRFPATSFAILYSVSALIRFNIATTSGFIVEHFGWEIFFIVSAAFSIPSIIAIVLRYIK